MMNNVNTTVVPEGFVLAYIPATLLTQLMAIDPASFTMKLPVMAGEERVAKEDVVLVPSVEPTATTTPVSMTTAPTTGKRRGRIPGRYRAVEGTTVNEDTLTPSEKAILRQMSQRRRGMTARALAVRLNTPQGTVGWAIARLVKAGLVEYVAATPVAKAKRKDPIPAIIETPRVVVTADEDDVRIPSPRVAHRAPRTHRAPTGYVHLTQHQPHV